VVNELMSVILWITKVAVVDITRFLETLGTTQWFELHKV